MTGVADLFLRGCLYCWDPRGFLGIRKASRPSGHDWNHPLSKIHVFPMAKGSSSSRQEEEETVGEELESRTHGSQRLIVALSEIDDQP